jgi:hypothetical protein
MVIHELWIGKDLEGNDHGRFEVLSCHLPGGIEGNHEKSVRITGVPAEFRTENLPTASQFGIIRGYIVRGTGSVFK